MYLKKKLSLKDLKKICKQGLKKEDYPLCSFIKKNIVVYEGNTLRKNLSLKKQESYKSEMAKVFEEGSGIVVIQNFFKDTDIIDKMNTVFNAILKEEENKEAADHFAKGGQNARIWNAFEKSAMKDAKVFLNYYKNPLLSIVAKAWLGSNYQVTSQVNIIYPTGKAQAPHRDYHLGFQENTEVLSYPLHAQIMSRLLTLQGGVAHVDIPVKSGPTKFLPFSQQYELGYLAWREEEFKSYFEKFYVQLSLKKGDAIFFNPAVFHAGGENKSKNIIRSVNLLQLSSAFSKPMESVDLYKISLSIYKDLRKVYKKGLFDECSLDAILTASSDAYSFPTNLDKDLPLGTLCPQTLKELCKQALKEDWKYSKFKEEVSKHKKRRDS